MSFGGQTAVFIDVWGNLTSDKVIFEIIKGVNFELDFFTVLKFNFAGI